MLYAFAPVTAAYAGRGRRGTHFHLIPIAAAVSLLQPSTGRTAAVGLTILL